MEVGMGDVTMEGEQGHYRAGSNGARGHAMGDSDHEGLDLTELSNSARELASRARDWIVANPFAALGIAVGGGFLIGRAMRMWALRP
jgi:hypothetical protein